MSEEIEERLIDLIVSTFKEVPLGTKIKEDDLLDSLPNLERQSDETFKIIHANTVLDEYDLSDIVIDALTKLENEGYFVDGLYSNEYRLFERLTPDNQLDLDALKEMEYREEIAINPLSPEGFILKDRTLSEIEKHFSDEEAVRVDLSDGQLNKLHQIINGAGVANWKEEYRPPEGVIVMDGSSWSFKMIFEGNKAFASRGDNAWPEGFEEFYKSIMSMLEEGSVS